MYCQTRWSIETALLCTEVEATRCHIDTVHTACVPVPHDHGQHNQTNTTRGIKQSCSLDDGYNDARNMLRVN